ncbi:MAG TPA: efflux RND transporter periplasmic adaptor subunit [Polyangiaceae bacterium]|nr:efflux RND transporter periplasmic adaptor subunit [Polyangiaceae bacterium]
MADLTTDLASLKIQREEDPNRPKPWRLAVIALLVLGAAAAAWLVVYPAIEASIFKTEVSVTEISVVSPAQASVTVTSTGYVVPQVTSKVGAKMTGRVAKVFVKEGSVVKAGEIIAELDATDQRSSIVVAGSRAAAAVARIETARANLADIEQQAARERALVEKGAVGKAPLQDLEARVKSAAQSVKAAEAEARAAQAEVNPLRISLQDRTITSPINGTVITKPVGAGELVGPVNNVNVAEIVDFASIVVETDVPEARLYQIKPGSPCEIVLDAYPGKRYRGETVEIAKRVDRAKATVKVKVKFVDPMDGVLPDMSARTSFLSEQVSAEAIKQKPKTVVPSSALTERSGSKVVFVINEGVVKVSPVKLGPAFANGFELVEGPAAGARVVVEPPAQLADGQKVKEKGS